MTPASPFSSVGHGELARVGVALSHGFTGSTASMLDWAGYLAEQGFTVSLPLLAGHGTTWQELGTTPWEHWYRDFESAYLDLAGRCEQVFVAGLSMGGALALRVAERHPVAGLALVNPALTFGDRRARYAGVLKYALRSTPSIGNDIKRPGADEHAYTRTPVAAVHQLSRLFRDTIAGLDRVTAPTLVFRSTVDNVVPDSSMDLLSDRLGASDFNVVALSNSYHVATLDNDAQLIFEQSADFFRKHAHG